MKKLIIGSLVGAVILFVWSAFSWMVLPIHTHSFMYSPGQDTIMQALNANMEQTGAYVMPSIDNRNVEMFDAKYQQECQKFMEQNKGKPSAMIFYMKEGMTMSGSTFAFGFLFDWIAVLCAVIFLAAAGDKLNTFYQRWWMVMLIGVAVAMQGKLLDWNWMGFPWHFVKWSLIDIVVQWGLCGAWLAWYLGRK